MNIEENYGGIQLIDRLGFMILCGAIFFNALANVLIKVGMINKTDLFYHGLVNAFIRIITNPFAFIGITSFGIAFVLYSGVLSKLDLSMAYPIMTGTGFLLVILASIFLFREQINIYRLIGIIAIVFGISMISLKG